MSDSGVSTEKGDELLSRSLIDQGQRDIRNGTGDSGFNPELAAEGLRKLKMGLVYDGVPEGLSEIERELWINAMSDVADGTNTKENMELLSRLENSKKK